MEGKSLVQKYISKLRFAKKSENTIKQYEPRLEKLDSYLIENHGISLNNEVEIRQITGAIMEEWQEHLRDSGAGESTEAAFVAAARSFFAWALKSGVIERDPSLTLTTVSVTRKEQPHLEWDAVERLMEVYDIGDWRRNRCILALGFIMALRVMSIHYLNIGDVGEKKLRFLNKGGAIITAYLPDVIKDMLDQYIRIERPGAGPDEPLFLSRTGRRLGIRDIQRMCNQAGALIGEKLTAHAMRRSSLSRINEIEGKEMAQAVAVHSSGATTKRYLYDSQERMDALYKDMNILSFEERGNDKK